MMTRAVARWHPLILLFLGCLVYSNAVSSTFVFDDILIGKIHYDSRPLFALSLWVNRAIHGRNAAGFHLVNIGIHLLAVLALYGVVSRSAAILAGDERREGTHRSIAFTVALVWMIHPLQTESVAYVWQRSESMMGLFFLTSQYCVIRCAQAGNQMWWGVAAVFAFICSLASKEVGAVLPLVLLVHDRTFLAGSFRMAIRARWGLYLAFAVLGALLFFLLIYRQLLHHPDVGFGMAGITSRSYAVTQFEVIAHYLKLCIWPHPLCVDYGWPLANSVSEVLPSVIFLLALAVGTLCGLVRKSWLGVAGAWFFLILSPTSSVVPLADAAVEHRMYLSSAAVVLVLVIFGRWLLARSPAGLGRLQPILAAGVVVALATTTVRRNDDYRSAVKLMQQTVAVAPLNGRARANLGAAFLEAGETERAIPELLEAVRLTPRDPGPYRNLGRAYLRLQDVDRAIPYFEVAVRLHGDSLSLDALGHALFLKRDYSGAADRFAKAIEMSPRDPGIHYRLGMALTSLGRLEEARVSYVKALRRDPEFQEAHINLAALLLNRGRASEALEHSTKALEILPNSFEEHFNLGVTLRALGRFQEAMDVFLEASRMAPGVPEPLEAFADTVCMKPDASLEERKEALRLASEANRISRSARPDFLATCARAHAALGDYEEAIALVEKALQLPGPSSNEVFASRLRAQCDDYRRLLEAR